MNTFKLRTLITIVGLLVLALIGACQTNSKVPAPGNHPTSKSEKQITLATTTSTQDSGLLDAIIPDFEKQYRIRVKVVAVGTGQAFAIGQKGDADVLLVHARAEEEKFVAEGWGGERRGVMHNQFLLLGPQNDPARIASSASIKAALAAIQTQQVSFVSRGDNSGTHKKELALWQEAGITPQGSWYLEAGQGMGDTLMLAHEKQAYTLADEATYLTMKDKLNLVVVQQGSPSLLNSYGVIAVNPQKFSEVNHQGALAFISYLTSVAGQKRIYNFGRAAYGKSLFIPDAVPLEQLE